MLKTLKSLGLAVQRCGQITVKLGQFVGQLFTGEKDLYKNVTGPVGIASDVFMKKTQRVPPCAGSVRISGVVPLEVLDARVPRAAVRLDDQLRRDERHICAAVGEQPPRVLVLQDEGRQ